MFFVRKTAIKKRTIFFKQPALYNLLAYNLYFISANMVIKNL